MQYGLIGCPLGHSFSKEIHEALGRYSYALCELKPDDVATFLHQREFCGINVTIPYKQTVIPFLDEISDRAKAIGAVNTIVNRDGRLYGDNTDFDGMRLALLHAGIALSGKNVLILGTGGTSKTAEAVAASLGAQSIRKVSRTGKDGALTYEQAYRIDANVILNTTPCGMFPHSEESPITLDRFPHLSGVFDAIYHPLSTQLVRDATERNIPASGGLYMLVAQAVRAAERFTGEAFPLDAINQLYRKVLRQKQNLILIGMPGVGKTRVGTRLSELMHRPFFDSDQVILERIGMPIADYFAQHGEAAFRAVESEVLAELSAQSGIVLSTGGGAVLKEENVRALRSNGILLFLDRPVDELKVSDDRPLSSDRERVRNLFAVRYPIYLAAADKHIRSGKNANETAHMILEELE
ncbi:MAG: shikimate dehydrogenase [Clostridia bacterium]|nr:shikimate dehydrogenase [Clostridia bacterium]